MPETPPSNAKIYPRPESKAPSPWLLALAVMAVLLVSFFAYRAFTNRAAAPSAQAGSAAEGRPQQQRSMPASEGR